ncbi:hypothetical protein GDO81_018818 [Engystomops pustulosus]|uniref:Uncharacterized protein n=1 Tax=Engystomops pustulosus TaxID=76066 RepID=A0AAV6YX22_ENGPU|nr:hypothetical protein GDO81_018818 [Engystomops pustulosus]
MVGVSLSIQSVRRDQLAGRISKFAIKKRGSMLASLLLHRRGIGQQDLERTVVTKLQTLSLVSLYHHVVSRLQVMHPEVSVWI